MYKYEIILCLAVAHNLIVRGFDNNIHLQLGEMANQRGVSINSIVKDAVDLWLKHQQSQVTKKHHLVIYSEDDSMEGLLKSMDRLAKESDLIRCFCGPPGSPSSRLLSKLKWYDGTIMPYYYSNTDVNAEANAEAASLAHKQNNYEQYLILQRQNQKQQLGIQTRGLLQSQKNAIKYCEKVIKNLAKHSNNRQVCCLDFLINDVARASLKQTLTIEESYNNDRLPGLTYCTYKTATLLNSGIRNILELFQLHDQIFLLTGDEVHKLHVTKENVHKLFLN
ncbi:MAG TPA: hypothetical protein VH796_15335 [Nitrososphaeraceae archaeon]|jgi:hypothetical protein